MIEIEDIDSGLRVIDAGKNEITIQAPDWEYGGIEHEINRVIDATVVGSASKLRLPEAAVCVESENRRQWRTDLGNGTKKSRIEPGTHLVQVETKITVYIRFDGEAVIYRSRNHNAIVVSFPERTALTIGFRSRVRHPIGELSIQPELPDIARGITVLGSAHRTTSPDRSYPTMREHPPLLHFGPETHLPSDLEDYIPETGIITRVPAHLDYLFLTAPLAYYLQSSVVIEDRPTVSIHAPDANFTVDFSPLPDFQVEVAETLRRIFYLDCLVRNAGPYGTELAELPLLDDIGLSAGQAYRASAQERFTLYHQIPFQEIATELPEWHLCVYIEPRMEYIPVLPHLLDRLSVLYLANGSHVDRRQVLRHSLDEQYRSESPRTPELTDLPLLSQLYPGRFHGWIADGKPINAFKILPVAFENRLNYLDRSMGPRKIIVILNDPGMQKEQSVVSRIYSERATELQIDVDIQRNLTRDELTDVFARKTDFIHFIGHCEDDGLWCRDRNLSLRELDESNCQTFFLNACDSYEEGLDLIQKGSVAGVVTLRDVLDEQATRVGTVFARLVIHGFSIEQALQIAKHESIVSNNYLVVGDGTHSLSQGDDIYPSVSRIQLQDSDTFQFEIEFISSQDNGGVYRSYAQEENSNHLFGNKTCLQLSKPDLLEHLQNAKAPVLYDNNYYWSDELFEELSGEPVPTG